MLSTRVSAGKIYCTDANKAQLQLSLINGQSQASTIIGSLAVSLIASLTTDAYPANLARIERLLAYYKSQHQALKILEPEHSKVLDLLREVSSAKHSTPGDRDSAQTTEQAIKSIQTRQRVYLAELERLSRRMTLLQGALELAGSSKPLMFRHRMLMIIEILSIG
jgi:hypothetical protein